MENKSKKIILITGASGGIGRALVKLLIEDGNIVIGVSRRHEELVKLSLKVPSTLFQYFVCDVSDTKSVNNLKDELLNKHIMPDVVICAAAISENDYEPTYNSQMIRETMEINFFGTSNFVESFYPLFINRKYGHFISISSISAFKPSIKSLSYGSSKAAISMLFRGLQIDSKNKNYQVDFSNIYLGPVDTQMWEGKKSFLVTSPDKIARNIRRVINHPKTSYFAPFLSTTLFRISLLIPDYIYVRLGKYLFK